MKAATAADLDRVYAGGPDPWDFRNSPYEAAKFAATGQALARENYRAMLEVGCGNGELARRLAPRTGRYVGLDAVEIALAEARRAVPSAVFVRAFIPGALPDEAFDAVILSEVLYFLDAAGIGWLAREVGRRWPQAEVLAVNFRRCTGDSLGGDAAAGLFAEALTTHRPTVVTCNVDYRIDRFVSPA